MAVYFPTSGGLYRVDLATDQDDKIQWQSVGRSEEARLSAEAAYEWAATHYQSLAAGRVEETNLASLIGMWCQEYQSPKLIISLAHAPKQNEGRRAQSPSKAREVTDSSLQAAIAFAFLFHAVNRGGTRLEGWRGNDEDFVITGALVPSCWKIGEIRHVQTKFDFFESWAALSGRRARFFYPSGNEKELSFEGEQSRVRAVPVSDMQELFSELAKLVTTSHPPPSPPPPQRPAPERRSPWWAAGAAAAVAVAVGLVVLAADAHTQPQLNLSERTSPASVPSLVTPAVSLTSPSIPAAVREAAPAPAPSPAPARRSAPPTSTSSSRISLKQMQALAPAELPEAKDPSGAQQ